MSAPLPLAFLVVLSDVRQPACRDASPETVLHAQDGLREPAHKPREYSRRMGQSGSGAEKGAVEHTQGRAAAHLALGDGSRQGLVLLSTQAGDLSENTEGNLPRRLRVDVQTNGRMDLAQEAVGHSFVSCPLKGGPSPSAAAK